VARCQLLCIHRASGCLDSSCSSLSATSTTLRVRVPRHVARLVAQLVVNYFASCRLVVDYFAYAVHLGASARRGARHAARRRLLRLAQARRRLLRLRRASGCFCTLRGSSRGSLSTTSSPPRVRVPRLIARLVVDYFDYAARLIASACRAARRVARCRLLCIRCVSGCLDLSCGSLSTTSTTMHVRVPRHVARLITPLVVDYLTYAARPGASTHRVARHAARRRLLRLAQARCRLLRLHRVSGCLGTSRGSSSGSSSNNSPTPHVWLLQLIAQLVL
jgi:hypothetical protein